VAAVAVLAAVIWTWPLATALRGAIPTNRWHCLGSGCEDEFLCYWIVTALGQRLAAAPSALFEGGILLPLRHTLAFSETMLTAVALTAPITWLTGEPVLAYNLHYLSTIALALVGTYLLVRDATGDARAAVVAGLLFAVAAERWPDRGHLAKQSVQWVPFLCWTWLRFLDRPAVGRGVALAAITLANLHSSVYQGLGAPVLLVPWALALAASRRWPWRRWASSLAVIGVAMAAGLVLYLPFVVVRDEQQVVTSGLAEVLGGWAWYTTPFLHPVAYLRELAEPSRMRLSMSPVPPLALVVALVVAQLRRPVVPGPSLERTHLIAALAFVLFTVAATLGEERLGPFGPVMHAIFSLPGLDGLRGRSRFVTLVAFGWSVVFGIALAVVLRRVRRPTTAALVTFAAVAIVLVDNRALRESTPLSWLPGPDDVPPAVKVATLGDGGLLHLPYGQWASETVYMMWALHHRHPIMNGYTAIMPRFGPLVRSFPSSAALQALADIGVTHVLLHPPAQVGWGAQMVQRIREHPELTAAMVGDTLLVTLPHRAPTEQPPAGVPLPRDGWRLDGSDPGVERAVDGDPTTHWTTATYDRPTFLRIDLGRDARVTGVRLRLGLHYREYPFAWEAWGSTDGTHWERLGGQGREMPPPFAAYVRDHRAVDVDLAFPPATVRMLELRVPPERTFGAFDSHGLGAWGVHELEVLGE
jgi:hypothetical protein